MSAWRTWGQSGSLTGLGLAMFRAIMRAECLARKEARGAEKPAWAILLLGPSGVDALIFFICRLHQGIKTNWRHAPVGPGPGRADFLLVPRTERPTVMLRMRVKHGGKMTALLAGRFPARSSEGARRRDVAGTALVTAGAVH